MASNEPEEKEIEENVRLKFTEITIVSTPWKQYIVTGSHPEYVSV